MPTYLSALTKIEAVNRILRAGGEAPVTNLTAPTLAADPNVARAVEVLDETSREVQTLGWRFNTEFGYEVLPTVEDFDWTDSLGTVTPLNIFQAPAGLLSFAVSATAEQQGGNYVDTTVRVARRWTVGGSAAPVLYDRALNRDGFYGRRALYLDCIFGFDFDFLPQSARTYITLLAARKYLKDVVGSRDLVGLTDEDLADALRTLKRDQGEEDDFNIFRNASVYATRGGRPFGPSGVLDFRGSPS